MLLRIRLDSKLRWPPYGYDKTGAMVKELQVKTYTRRGVKDPSHPKRARGSFVYFSTEMVSVTCTCIHIITQSFSLRLDLGPDLFRAEHRQLMQP